MKISFAGAWLTDKSSMAAVIGKIPDGQSLEAKIRSGEANTFIRYIEESRTAFYIVSDYKVVMCWTVSGVTNEQAEAILRECDSIALWDTPAFIAAAERALGIRLDLIQ